ncbi:MAG: DUF805 domain-containing protein [Proteobacteria bacterium]|nr:DUF805 domain-containing protein [Pseudomonadota bacterium]
MQWLKEVIAKYATFRGRARRREYWRYILYYVIAFVALVLVDMLTGTFNMESQLGFLSGLFLLFMLIPSVAVAVRRLHDTERSGWWVLLALLPLIGQLVLLFFFIQEGDEGDNAYGPDPKFAQ